MPTKTRRTLTCARCGRKAKGCTYSETCHECRRRLGLPDRPAIDPAVDRSARGWRRNRYGIETRYPNVKRIAA